MLYLNIIFSLNTAICKNKNYTKEKKIELACRASSWLIELEPRAGLLSSSLQFFELSWLDCYRA
ncbi:hypothetical protein HanIR_Chr07g0313981 [Helianthus annuus]|nr:hypothetical protein HanIR_Chr07g0313981 [Helianthus annuus]